MKTLIVPSGADGLALYRHYNQVDADMDLAAPAPPAFAVPMHDVCDPTGEWVGGAVNWEPDVIHASYSGGVHNLVRCQGIKDKTGARLVVDIDDNFFDVPEYNVGGQGSSTRGQKMKVWTAWLNSADAITTTTPTIASVIASHTTIPVHIVPNTVRPDWFDEDKRPHDDIRIVLTGASGNHWAQVEFMSGILREVHDSHDNVKIAIFGHFPAQFLDLPRVYSIRWAPVPLYFRLLKHLAPDIGLAPLMDNPFNRCKSAIKYYEYAMAGAAGVYSALDPYEEVTDGVTGLVVPNDEHEWLSAIDRLITDVDTRRRISHNAYEDVRLAHSRSGALAAVLEEVVNDRNCKRVTA
jgi:glycosyltransferase involved in cell wall biosynthesis